MKSLSLTLFVPILGLFVLGCQRSANPVDVSPLDQNGTMSPAAANVLHDNFVVPVDEIAFNPCAGEDIHFTGAFHVETHLVIDAKGGIHSQFTANDYNLRGVGLTSGNRYRRVGATTDSFNASGPPPLEETFTNTFNFIGQGPGNNFLAHQVFHITINANGVVTVIFDKLRIECR